MAGHQPKPLSARTLAILTGWSEESPGQGFSKDVILNYMGGRTDIPDGFLTLVKAKLNLPEHWPQPHEISDARFPVPYPEAQMPYAGKIPAGQWVPPSEAEMFEDVESRLYKRGRFCARVEGYSCFPALQPEDFTIWEETHSPPIGKIIIAQRKGDHAATIKQLVWDREASRMRLHAINQDFAENLPEHWGAIGYLIYIRYYDDAGNEVSFYREDGLNPDQLIKYRQP